MTQEQAEIIALKEHDKVLLKQEYYAFINNLGAKDCFENVIEFLDKCKLLKTKKLNDCDEISDKKGGDK